LPVSFLNLMLEEAEAVSQAAEQAVELIARETLSEEGQPHRNHHPLPVFLRRHCRRYQSVRVTPDHPTVLGQLIEVYKSVKICVTVSTWTILGRKS